MKALCQLELWELEELARIVEANAPVDYEWQMLEAYADFVADAAESGVIV
jgi:hypothetical protein